MVKAGEMEGLMMVVDEWEDMGGGFSMKRRGDKMAARHVARNKQRLSKRRVGLMRCGGGGTWRQTLT